MNNNSSVHESVRIFLTWLTPLWLFFLFDPEIIFSFVDRPYHQTPAADVLRIGLLFLNLGLYAGAFGTFVRLAGREKYLVTREDFFHSLRRHWPAVLIFWGMALAIHFILFLLAPQASVTLRLVYACFQIPLLALLVYIIIRKEYLTPLNLKQRKIVVGREDIAGLLAGFVLLTGLHVVPFVVQWPQIDLFRIALLGTRFMELWVFIGLAFIILRAYPEIEKSFVAEKEIVLISPINISLSGGIGSFMNRTYPAVFVVLKALTPAGYRFEEFNRVIWHSRYVSAGKLVCITSFTSNAAEAYKIAKEFRRAGAKVVMGGPHVTYVPEEALEFCDSVVIGDAERVWQDVIRDYESGQLKKKYSGGMAGEYSNRIHEALLNSPPEVIKDFLETTRGCKFRCRFCTIPGLSGGKIIKKPVFDLVELISRIQTKYRHVTFIDNNIYSDPAYAQQLFEALKPLKIRWATQCTLDIAKNAETLKLARDSGCDMLFVGYETFVGSAEKVQGGKFAMTDRFLEFSQRIKALGIRIKANFICGWDSDTPSTLWDLWKFCFKLKPFFTVLSLYTPLPGSGVYDDMVSANRLTNLNWSRYDCRSMVFRHPRLQPKIFSAVFPVLATAFLLTTCTLGYIILGSVFGLTVLSFVFLRGV